MTDNLILDGSFARSLNESSNQLLECPDIAIQTPDPSTVYRGDKADYIVRMNNIASPNERLLTLVKSIFNPSGEPTHEAFFIRKVTFTGVVVGFIHGGLMKSQHIHADYIRKHNASVFSNKVLAERHFWDNLVWRIATQGTPYALKSGLLCAAASFTALGSIVYRNDLYLPDWLIGFTTLGSISRCWLGMRGVVGGGMFGVAAGLIGFGLARGFELVTKQSVSQMRYVEHTLWLARQEAKRAAKLRASHEEFSERMQKLN